jgi:polysaccharide chain length determinant protein (PEP-CTERM system associated)
MSVEFRQRKPSEYLKIAWRRKWLIILPAFAVATSVAAVVYRLPDVYLSSTLIVVKPSTLPTGVVPTATDENSLTRQLTSIAQVVTSRSSLEPLVAKYDLYRTERQRGEPMEAIIDMMRLNIIVEVNTSRNEITNGFNIGYRGRDPRTTQLVTADLAAKYTDEQTKLTLNNSTSAKEFIGQQVKLAKDELDAADKQRLEFMQKNISNLPQQEQSLMGQLTGLREQQKALINEVGRLQDRRSVLTNSLSIAKKQSENNRSDVAENMTDPKTTPAWAGLVQRRAALESELQRLLTELKPKHPDVLAKQAELDSVKKEMDTEISDWKDRIKEKEDKLSKRPDLLATDLESQIKIADGEIKREQDMLAANEKQISDLMARLNSVPEAQVALSALDRDYLTKKGNYDSLLAQQNRIALGADAASSQQGEGIQVIDAANLPSVPVAPRRWALTAGGLALGLALGLICAGIFEMPKLFTIQTSADAAHYTGLPVLVSVPELLSPQEVRTRPLRRRLLLALGVVATIVSIPALFFVLRATHLFERFVS